VIGYATSPWRDELLSWAAAMRAARLSPTTVDLRLYHVNRLSRAYPAASPWSLTLDDLLQWLGGFSWSRETARSYRSSLQRFYAWAVETERTRADPAARLPIVQPGDVHVRPATPAAVRSGLADRDGRVVIMVRLADELGMRRGEVVQGHSRDLFEDVGGWSLRVHGKGAKQRIVPVPDDLARALLLLPAGFYFPGAVGGHMSPSWAGRLVGRALAEATMHQLRHRCASDTFNRTGNIRLVQRLLGHASVATTERYTYVPDAAVRAAVVARSAEIHGLRRVA
jgi:integrase